MNIRLTTPPRPSHPPIPIADLASTGAMDDPAFIAYLEYLRYWEQPRYAKFVHYPHAFYGGDGAGGGRRRRRGLMISR